MEHYQNLIVSRHLLNTAYVIDHDG